MGLLSTQAESTGAPPTDETEELSHTLLWAIHLADDEADPPDWCLVEPEPPAVAAAPCPPHHWLIGDNPDPSLFTLSCVRCGDKREQPRDPEPAWRNRMAGRVRAAAPEPSFG
jgi:hypothetical protein